MLPFRVKDLGGVTPMNPLLKVVGLALGLWLAIFYGLEVIATVFDPYHNSGGPAIISAVITAFIGYSWISKSAKKN